MAGRRLSAEEEALWRALARTVRPLRRAERRVVPPPPQPEPPVPAPAPAPRKAGRVPPPRPTPPPPAPPRPEPAEVLDSSWEKRIRAGRLQPERSIDLHGHNLAAAHLLLDRLIGEAVAQGLRVLLVVTGKPRPSPGPGDHGKRRGAIRAEIGHWLAIGPHADRIASVRQAHPRHGGDGALYIILRRTG